LGSGRSAVRAQSYESFGQVRSEGGNSVANRK
jgi:hypothetical protein